MSKDCDKKKNWFILEDFIDDYGFVSTEGNTAEEIAKVIQTNYYWRKMSWIL